jgi:hypothetical protein
VFLLILAQRRLGLVAQLAIDRTGVHPYGRQALLDQFDMIFADELLLFRGLLARRPRRPGLDQDGTQP